MTPPNSFLDSTFSGLMGDTSTFMGAALTTSNSGFLVGRPSNQWHNLTNQKPVTVQFETAAFNKYLDRYLNTLTNNEITSGLGLLRVCHELIQRIIYKSPVQTGESRAGWFLPATRIANRLKIRTSYRLGSPQEQRGYGTGAVNFHLRGLNKWVEFSNATPYEWRLEFGWSSMAPWGMVRISMQEIRNAIPASIAAQLKDMWDNEKVAYGTTWRAGGYWEPKYVTGKLPVGALRMPTTIFRKQIGKTLNKSTLGRALRGSTSGKRRR